MVNHWIWGDPIFRSKPLDLLDGSCRAEGTVNGTP